MCVAAIAWAAHPDWQLIALANRDEFHTRPAAPLVRWDNGILAGRDLKSGGSWLGVCDEGRIALVTNRRGFGDPQADKASRGALVCDLLTASGSYGDVQKAELQDFNPFNLFFADQTSACLLSNRPDDQRTALTPGIYGLSNGALDEPWPKAVQLNAALGDWLDAGSGDATALFAALASETLPTTGASSAAEGAATPIFVRNGSYGTRCSSVIMVNCHGEGQFFERRFDSGGNETGETKLAFSWAG